MKAGIQWLFIIMSGVLVVNLMRSVQDLFSRRHLVQQEEDRLLGLRDEHAVLTEQLREATSAAFIEKEARNRLNLARDGEIVVIIPSPVPPTPTPTMTPKKPNWVLWKEALRL